MAHAIRITEAQMTALITAGVFEMPEGGHALIAAAVNRNRLNLSISGADIARAICDLSNDADESVRDLSGDEAAWARKDARVLANLYSSALRVIH